MKYFSDINTEEIKDRLIILDIDGTIIADGEEIVGERAIAKINDLKRNNKVYLFSNKGNTERNKKIFSTAGISYINSTRRKPSKKVLDSVKNGEKLPILIVGDKFLTDGLFAKNIGADFLKVRRITSVKDDLFFKFLYMFDDAAHIFWRYLSLVRPLQWVKNLLVFVPIFFAAEIFVADKFLPALYTFISFCLTAGAMYIINDLIDKEQDRLHPKKKTRPLASGEVSVRSAVFMMMGLVFSGLLVAYFLALEIIFVIIAYIFLNLLYSFYLKKAVIFDILAISGFYLLRIEAGGLATETPISRWLIMCLLFASLLIIIGKRKAESLRENKREVLSDRYSHFLHDLLNIAAGLTILSYGLYSVLGISSPLAIYSLFFVLAGILRYLYLYYASGEKAEFPEKMIFTDKIIFGSITGWVAFMYLIFYL